MLRRSGYRAFGLHRGLSRGTRLLLRERLPPLSVRRLNYRRRMADKSIARMRVTEPKAFDLDKCDPGETFGWRKAAAAIELLDVKAELDKLQQRLAAENRRSLLLILQARDAAGKDGTVRAIFSGLNPAGVRVTSFKVPAGREASQDYLWRGPGPPPRGGGDAGAHPAP